MPARSTSTGSRACSAATRPACPFADDSFDVVITSEVLEHIQNDVAAIAEMVRVLKPGGTFAATVPAWLPEKINWMLVGRVPRADRRRWARSHLLGDRAVGEAAQRRPRSPRPSPGARAALAVLVAEVRRRPTQRRPSAGGEVPRVPRVGHHDAADVDAHRRPGALAGDRQEHRVLRRETGEQAGHRERVDGIGASHERASPTRWRDLRRRGARHGHASRIAAARLGHDPVVRRRALRSVEPRRVGDGPRRGRPPHRGRAGLRVAGRHPTPRRQGGTRTTANDGSIEDHKIDTNVCAYIAAGVYHHYRSTWDRGLRREPLARGRARTRVRPVTAPPRWSSAVGRRTRIASVELCAADRHVEHPALAALRRRTG